MACRGVFAVSLGAGRGQTGIACRMLCMVSRTQPWCGVRSRPLNGAAAVLGGDRGKSIHSMPSPPSTPLATGWIRAWLAPRALTDRGGGGSALGANQGGECALLGSVPDPLTIACLLGHSWWSRRPGKRQRRQRQRRRRQQQSSGGGGNSGKSARRIVPLDLTDAEDGRELRRREGGRLRRCGELEAAAGGTRCTRQTMRMACWLCDRYPPHTMHSADDAHGVLVM